MAKIKRVIKKKDKKSKPSNEVSQVKVTLPDKVSSPSDSLQDYSILIYGEKKIGKTSLASKFKDAFFLMFESGAKALSIFKRPVKTWNDFKAYVQLLSENERFTTIVIDPIDVAYKLCTDYVCKELVIDHPSDEGWGKGWAAVKNEFLDEINKLLHTGKGVIFISHAADKEIKTRTGDTYHKIMPTMSGQARDVLEGIVDVWAYYCYEKDQRILVIAGDDHVGAGHRLEKRFKFSNGERIKEIPMENSAGEAYQNFIKAFNNNLEKKGGNVNKKVKLTIKRKKT